ncbi:MAG: hypothetical protein LBQ33_02940 [Oscillospiraceae bacterium]|jgi:sedoheptulokinase|nr:hypothetical protein [Oscillospiraceae bacterium]
MPRLGLDIGTTSICAVVLREDGRQLFAKSAANSSGIKTAYAYEAAQDPQRIWEICQALLRDCLAAVPGIVGIGVTGQMHGLLYLDEAGNSISPLYTWQDESGSQPIPGAPEDESHCQRLSRLTGYAVSSGFGCATLFCHAAQGRIPAGAAQICTIHAYAAMRLCGKRRPLLHHSDAASFGLFDLKAGCFDPKALEAAQLPPALFPALTAHYDVLGDYRGIPVRVAIGDNQASFLGAAKVPANSVLVNFGTGSQLSLCAGFLAPEQIAPGAELRPLCGEQYLYVGSALCGGRAYALLEEFFRQCAEFLGCAAKEPTQVYAAMDRLLRQTPFPADPLRVDPRFAGERQAPHLRGGIERIGLQNFTPGHLLWGLLEGMAEELHRFYAASGLTRTILVGAGNALRKNEALRRAVERRFGLPLILAPYEEEAASGAALIGD